MLAAFVPIALPPLCCSGVSYETWWELSRGVELGVNGDRCAVWARGKELEENGFGVVLDKKRARPLRPRPDRFFVLAR